MNQSCFAIRCRTNREGMVLIIVTVVVAMVSLSALGFLVSMRSENLAAHLQADQLQVDTINASALEMAIEFSRLSRTERKKLINDESNAFRDVLVDWEPFGDRHGRFSILVPTYEPDRADALFRFGLQSTSAKLSLSQLLLWDAKFPGHARIALMNLPGMTEAIADSILDWIDNDDEPREFGAESEFYVGLDPPRQPPNEVPQHLSGLLAVRGITEFQLLGNPNGMQFVENDENENQLSSIDPSRASSMQSQEPWQVLGQPWSYYLTTYSAERNENVHGARRIDLNQDSLGKLYARLSRDFTSEVANFVVAVRKHGPAEVAIDQATSTPVPTQSASGTASFTFESSLDIIDMVVEVKNPNARSNKSTDKNSKAYQSPFKTSDPASLTQLVRFLDRTFVGEDAPVTGRIDVLTAPRPVMLSIPQLSPALVDEIIAARESEAREENETRVHASWLLAEGFVDLPTFRQLVPYITVGGDVFEAQTVAYYDVQSPWSRAELMVNGSTEMPNTLYYRDLSRLGRGFRLSDLMLPTTETALPTSPTTGTARPTRPTFSTDR